MLKLYNVIFKKRTENYIKSYSFLSDCEKTYKEI